MIPYLKGSTLGHRTTYLRVQSRASSLWLMLGPALSPLLHGGSNDAVEIAGDSVRIAT